MLFSISPPIGVSQVAHCVTGSSAVPHCYILLEERRKFYLQEVLAQGYFVAKLGGGEYIISEYIELDCRLKPKSAIRCELIAAIAGFGGQRRLRMKAWGNKSELCLELSYGWRLSMIEAVLESGQERWFPLFTGPEYLSRLYP